MRSGAPGQQNALPWSAVHDAVLQSMAQSYRQVYRFEELHIATLAECAPSSQYCWWKLPKPEGGQAPGRSPGSTRTSGLSTRKRLNCRLVTCAAATPRSVQYTHCSQVPQCAMSRRQQSHSTWLRMEQL